MPPAKDDKNKTSSPRILFGDKGTTEKPAAPVTAATATGPKIPFGTPIAPRAPIEGPKIIGDGVVRRRIPCSPADLRTLEPDASDIVIDMALRIIEGVNLDDHEFDDVVRFGAALQQRHGELAEKELALAGDTRLAEVKRLSAELLQHLGALDPERLFLPRQRFLASLRTSLSGTTPSDLFQQHAADISRIAKLLAERAEDFLDLERSVQALKVNWNALALGLEAHDLAGRFVVRHIEANGASNLDVSAHYRSQKNALEMRLTSLAAAAASVALGARTLASMETSIANVRDLASETVERDLPAWYTACSAALAARSNGEAASVDVSGVRLLYSKIVNKLLWKDEQ
ncbi:MAG: hypothetical protein QM636_01225 [Rhizobium sp.]